MAGRILVVDAIPTNYIIMRVKLSAAYYEVVQASDGANALKRIAETSPDLVIVAEVLPDMSGLELISKIRDSRNSCNLPVVALHSDGSVDDRLSALAAGADDVLTKPVDDRIMLARLRSLLRTRDIASELQLRDDTSRALGLAEQAAAYTGPARVMVVPVGRQPGLKQGVEDLRGQCRHRIDLVPAEDALREQSPAPDLVVIVEGPDHRGDGLMLLAQMRANSVLRYAAMIYVAQPNQQRQSASALDMGANDLVTRGFDVPELALRLSKQLAHKRLTDRLRANMQDGMRAAVTDPLTELYNRRYALPHLERLAERAAQNRRPYALLLADLDHFKRVNDVYGHVAGDYVLVELARRLKSYLRAADLICRWGGEEFLIAMPDTSRRAARQTAERLCQIMTEEPVDLPDGRTVTVTLSIGVACSPQLEPSQPLDLIDRADRALYTAKDSGRNTVVLAEKVTPLPRKTCISQPAPFYRQTRKTGNGM